MSLETQPAALDEIRPFRIVDPREIVRTLRDLVNSPVPVHLSTDDGHQLRGSMQAVDSMRECLSVSVDPEHPDIESLAQSAEVMCVAFPGSVKLQFALSGLTMMRDDTQCSVGSTMPRELFRVQRRRAFRVRLPHNGTACATFSHPGSRSTKLSLKVLDISTSGCALMLPQDSLPFPAGVRIDLTYLELDDDTHFTTSMMVHHVVSVSGGWRLGCEFAGLDGRFERALQRFVDLVQRRQRWASALM